MDSIDRSDPYYKACVIGSVAGGTLAGNLVGAFGSFASVGQSLWIGPLVGAAVGFTAGYLVCPYIAPNIRNKIKGVEPIDEFVMAQAIGGMKQYAGLSNNSDAVKLLAVARFHGSPTSGYLICSSPRESAQLLLSQITSRV